MSSRAHHPSIFCDKAFAGLPQLLDDLHRLSEDQNSADVVFLLKDEFRVYAHKIILMARCKSFQTAKRGEICRIPGSYVLTAAPGAPTPIRLPHVNPELFRQFIVYVYTGKIMLHDARVFEMMTLAHELGVEELKKACEDHVVSTLSVANACIFLTAVLEIQEKASGAKCAASFMERCITYIGENASECVKTNSFLNLTKDGLIKLISSDYFGLEEEDVWRSVLAWAKHQAGVTQPTAHWTEEERARVCQHLSGVMEHVRLLFIDSQVFAEEVEPTGAVPMELSLERYRHAALQASKLPSSAVAVTAGNTNTATAGGNNVTTTTTSTLASGSGIVSTTINQNNGSSSNENDKKLRPRVLIYLFPGSTILINDKLHYQTTLNMWYGAPKTTWRLVFRASAYDFSAAAFHSFCDGIAPTYTIVLTTNGEIIGGFSDVAWSNATTKNIGYIASEKSYLFTLYNPVEPTEKYNIVKKPYAICYHPHCGPIFGAGADLMIANECNKSNDSYTNFPHSYERKNSENVNPLLDYSFLVSEYEVYTLANPEFGVKVKHDRGF